MSDQPATVLLVDDTEVLAHVKEGPAGFAWSRPSTATRRSVSSDPNRTRSLRDRARLRIPAARP